MENTRAVCQNLKRTTENRPSKEAVLLPLETGFFIIIRGRSCVRSPFCVKTLKGRHSSSEVCRRLCAVQFSAVGISNSNVPDAPGAISYFSKTITAFPSSLI